MKASIYSSLVLAVLALLVYEDASGHDEDVSVNGFDASYEVRYGDSNNDGYLDFYVRQPPEVVIISGDIITPIVLPPYVDQFLLIQNPADQSFTIEAVTSSADLVNWPLADVNVKPRDVNFDRVFDLHLMRLDSVVAGAADQIIYTDSVSGNIPIGINAVQGNFERFYFETFAWMVDHSYFRDNAPTVVDGTPPTIGSWFGSVVDVTDFFLVNLVLATCNFDVGSCAVSTDNPAQCIREVIVYDADGNVIGVDRVDVCEHSFHIYSYPSGSVRFVKDYSFFNQDALVFTREIERVSPSGLDGLVKLDKDSNIWPTLNQTLRTIVETAFGDWIFGRKSVNAKADDDRAVDVAYTCDDILPTNSIDHAPFIGDDDWDPSDPTFHHYDVVSEICVTGETGCSVSVFQNDILPLFSYPSRKLAPRRTPVDGTSRVMAYIAPPFLARFPSQYRIAAGPVTQQRHTTGNYPGVIQNITQQPHMMHPGTISRLVESGDQGPQIFTHGIGLNRYGSLLYPDRIYRRFNPTIPNIPSTIINNVLGCANDDWGFEAFKTLDRVAIEYWRDSQASGLQRKMSIPEAGAGYRKLMPE